MRRLVDAGVLLLAPEPPAYRMSHAVKGFLAQRDGLDFSDDCVDPAERMNRNSCRPHEVELGGEELALDPAFAAAVVGREWATSWESLDHEDDGSWEMFVEVVSAGYDVMERLGYAAAADATLAPSGAVENLLVDQSIHAVGEVAAVRTTGLLEKTSIPDLRGLNQSDVLAIRNSVEAFEAWRNWLETTTARSYLEASVGIGDPQSNFDGAVTDELRYAISQSSRSESLRRYARRDGSITAAKIAVKTVAGVPAFGDFAGALGRVLKALVRPRPGGHLGVLVRLHER